MRNSVIITAGGLGKRMQSHLPKQFLDLKGKPILQHTIDIFRAFDPDIFMVVVLPMQQIKFWKEMCEERGYNIDYEISVGGKERFHSIKQGLKFCKYDGIIGIHDAVRPFVQSATIKACYAAAEKHGAAIPAIPVNDSLRKINDDGSEHVERGLYRIIQTPQCFQVNIIKSAYKQDYDPVFTDDASVVEKSGHRIHLVNGNPENIKITTRNDLAIATTYMK